MTTQPNYFARVVGGRTLEFIEMMQVGQSRSSGSALWSSGCSAFMCMVIFIASRSPLPLIPWQQDTPAFNVDDLSQHEERVRSHERELFSIDHEAAA